MRIPKKCLCSLLLVGLLLILCSCAGASEESASLDERSVTVAAWFRQEDGTALRNNIIRISSGEQSEERTLDADGETRVSGLARDGSFALTVFDQQEQPRGAMSLTFTEGVVIDATTDESGNGCVTLKRDTEEIALTFLLRNDGTLQCALRLDESKRSGASKGVI